MLLALELAGQLLDRSCEHPRALSCDVRAPLPDEVFVTIADRVRHDDDGQARVSRALAGHLPERGEGGADDSYGRGSEVLEVDRVTRGPGCRGPSVADAVDDGVALLCHRLRERRRNPQVGFAPEFHLRAVFALEDIGYAA